MTYYKTFIGIFSDPEPNRDPEPFFHETDPRNWIHIKIKRTLNTDSSVIKRLSMSQILPNISPFHIYDFLSNFCVYNESIVSNKSKILNYYNYLCYISAYFCFNFCFILYFLA